MIKFSKPQKIILHFVLSFCILIFAFCIKGIVYAAELNLISQTQEINVGQQFQVDVILNTEGEQINAVEGKIVFPDELLEVKEIRDGNSIVNFWIERPKIEQAGVIGFSGIIPGGYQETKGFLFSVIFQAKAEGYGTIEIRDAKVLLNDSKGTLAKTTIFNFQFSISEQTPGSEFQIPGPKDTGLPEEFKPEIAADSSIFEGKWFLVFATQDKGSGIDRYEVLETRNKRQATRGWVEAESPYILRDQKLRSYIYVKAADKAGNERIAVVEPRYPLKWYETWWIWSIIGIILTIVIGFLIGRFLWKRYTKIHK
jgi:hypothetical protein